MFPQHSLDDLHGYFFEEIEVGMTASFAKTVTETDIMLFVAISGDSNPVHINYEFAAETIFKGPIAHGLLTASFISTVLGTKLPGPGCIYVKQELSFKAPVRAGDTVLAQVRVTELDERRQNVTLACLCSVKGKPVLTGEAVMRVDRQPKPPTMLA